MANENLGSFNYLHTFTEVAFIYKIDTSTLRKKIKRGELKIQDEVMKFGGTWLITEQAMIRHFGEGAFNYFKKTGKVSDWQVRPVVQKTREELEEEMAEDTFFI